MPLISVIIPNYNHGHLIGRALDGLLAQSCKYWECIVVDDCSTDDSREVIERYTRRDERIRLVSLENNRGGMRAFDVGYHLAQGQFLFCGAADDYISHAEFFFLATEALKGTELGAAFGKSKIVDATTGETCGGMGMAPHAGKIEGQDVMPAFLSGALFIPGAAVLLRRSVINAMGGFDDKLGPQADYYLNHALAAWHGTHFLNAEVSVVTYRPESYSNQVADEDWLKNHARVEAKLRACGLLDGIDPALVHKWRVGLALSRVNRNVNAYMQRAMELFNETAGPLQQQEEATA